MGMAKFLQITMIANISISTNNSTRQPDSIMTEFGKAELAIPPVDNSAKPLEFVFIIDESFSNANNGQNIILGFQNFVSQLPDTALSVKVYLIGKDNCDILGENGGSEIQLSSSRRKTTYLSKIKPAFFEVTKSSSTSTGEFKAILTAEFANVSAYLSKVTGGGLDTFPKVQEIAALMNERKGQGTKNRTIYIYATDEDVPANYTGTRFKSWITESIAVPVTMTGMFVFPTQTKQNLEGGGFVLVPGQLKGCPTCYPKVDSCSDIAGIKQAILENPT